MAGATNEQATKEAQTKMVVAAGRVRDKVSIVGFASHWTKANFDDSDFEVWCLNEFYGVATEQLKKPFAENRVRWFEIHGREEKYEGNPFIHTRDHNHAENLAKLPCPVYMQKHWDDIPNSVAYPLQQMMTEFSHQAGSSAYFTNSISFMLALAIHMGFKEIHIYGVDMAQGTEYASQRPSCEYFVGIAQAKGIRLHMPPESDLLKYSYLYGWEQPKHDALKVKLIARKDELIKRKAALEQQAAQIQAHIHMLNGAIEDVNYISGVWLDT